MNELWRAIIRLFRVFLAQFITFAIANWAGVNIPVLNISVGALINAVAKYLREKYSWTWLPV